jgi:hypothetical protein
MVARFLYPLALPFVRKRTENSQSRVPALIAGHSNGEINVAVGTRGALSPAAEKANLKDTRVLFCPLGDGRQFMSGKIDVRVVINVARQGCCAALNPVGASFSNSCRESRSRAHGPLEIPKRRSSAAVCAFQRHNRLACWVPWACGDAPIPKLAGSEPCSPGISQAECPG